MFDHFQSRLDLYHDANLFNLDNILCGGWGNVGGGMGDVVFGGDNGSILGSESSH